MFPEGKTPYPSKAPARENVNFSECKFHSELRMPQKGFSDQKQLPRNVILQIWVQVVQRLREP